MLRYACVALNSAALIAAATSFAWAQQTTSVGSGAPGVTQSNAGICPPFLSTAQAGRIANRAADRFEKQQSRTNSSSALTYLRDQLFSGLQSELSSVADAAAIRTLPTATVTACFPRLSAVIATLTQGDDYERFNAAWRERREREAQEQQAATDAARQRYDEIHQRNREAREAEAKERARLSALGSSGADVVRRSREIQAEQQRAYEAATAEAAKPENIMLTAYRNYLVVRQCFESRTGFEVVYLTPLQMDEAKAQVKGIEAGIVKRAPGLDTDERWAAANRAETAANGDLGELGFTGRGAIKERIFTEQGRQFCAAASGWLKQAYGMVYPDSLTVKKDF